MRLRSLVSVCAAIFACLSGLTAIVPAQNARNERDVRVIMRSLDSKIDDLRYSLNYGLRDSDEDVRVENDVIEVDRLIRSFQTNFAARRENGDDVLAILNASKPISDFLISNRVNNTVQKDWGEVKTLLEQLASNYSVNWNWNTGGSNSRTVQMSSNALTGTYRLDSRRTEDMRDIIENTNLSDDQRDDLREKLEPADEIAIDVRGNQVTLVSSTTSAVTFVADGRTRTENSGGKSVRIRAQINGDELTISSLDGDDDYTLTFSAEDNGRELKVTRRITTSYLDQTVFADSFYGKTDAVARLGIDQMQTTVDPDNTTYSSNDPDDDDRNAPSTRLPRSGDFIVPNGTMITGILENDVNTKISQNNDRFRMTVQSPNEYRGAVIEGYISGVNRSGKVSGRSQITFNFERITLRSGESYDFAGFLQSVTDQNGKTIKIDAEGAAKGNSQTKETVKRGGIGAGAGALIGAILGGGKGAAIGAIIGGGAGAGSVVVQGKDDLDLKRGSTFTVQASAPNK